ncbi:MAG TPA: pectate lyase [Bryobacteraceae bacterium]|nr:pectate lyase [Bryobacteraceae bacterium]
MKFSLCFLLLPAALCAQSPSRDDVLRAMRKAADFYRNKVSTEGGYHYYYTSDLSYGRSESAEGPTQVEVQREATPIVAFAYLDAYDVTGDRAYLEYARDAARALVRGQLCSGGWDYLIEFDPEKRKQYQYRADGNCGEDKRGVTNLDDNVTQAAVRVLMRVDRALNFSDPSIREAARFALEKMLAAQYPIGAWPQRFRKPADFSNFPVKRASYPESWSKKWPGPDYQNHYTFNDNTIADAIDMMLEAARIYNEPRYRASGEKGGQFILLAQMPDPQPAWAQQYDRDMHPAWARVFEPPSVTGGESQGIMRILMTLYRETGDRKYLEPIPRALEYLKRSSVPRTSAEVFRRMPEGPVMARFYELKTNRPLYITKGTRLSVAGVGSRTVDGYEISYSPESVITHYGVLTSGRELAAIEEDYRKLAAADPASIRRSEKLHGLSPWSERPRTGSNRERGTADVRQLIAAMDERGAWTKMGIIGRANRLVFAYAAKDMLLRIGHGRSDGSAGGGVESRGQLVPLKEDDTVEIFLGPQPPPERIISSADFAHNLTRLAEYVTGLQSKTSN